MSEKCNVRHGEDKKIKHTLSQTYEIMDGIEM